MTVHVDIVANLLTQRIHRCVAVVHRVEHGVKVEFFDTSYADVIPQVVWNPKERRDVHRDLDPDLFLDALQYELDGATLFATAPHEDIECLFGGSRRREVSFDDVRSPASA